MRYIHFLWGALLVLALATGCKQKREGQPRVLVFSKTQGLLHNAIPAAIKAIRQLGVENAFTIDTTTNAGYFTEDSLQHYAAVIFLNTTGDVLNNYQEADLERYIQAGGGYVGIHAAADTKYDWGWYGGLVGAYLQDHPAGTDKAKLIVTDKQFPATAGLPDTWEHTDEWYNFKKVDPTIKVVMKVDEKSYTGGKMGDNHPISWFHDYDGGRAFYTALGHTEAAFQDPNVLKHLLGGIQYAMGENSVLDYGNATTLRVPDEDRFSKTVLTSGNFFEPTEMAILPNFDVLVAQRRGQLMLFKNLDHSLKQVGDIHVYFHTDTPNVNSEEGLLGITTDPDYARNHYIYLYYSRADSAINRLSRFIFEDDRLKMESEKVILQFHEQRDMCCHTGGSLAFGNDHILFLSTGDNTTPFDEPGQTFTSKGYSPLDDRPGHDHYDDRRGSSNTNDLRGKILRIQIQEDGSYTIPEGNLFKPGTPNTKPEIYAMGTRNPYRISVDKHTGFVYWGDVGPDANNDDSLRGPRGYDEINQAQKPGYFGYPLFIADNKPYRRYDYGTGQSGDFFDPAHPVNDSRNNTGLRNLPPAQPAFIWYPYGPSTDFPQVGSGGRSTSAGPVYYAADYPEKNRFPLYYDGKLFIYDFMRGWIMAVTMDKEGHYSKMERIVPHMKFNGMIDMEMGPDGRLYVLEYGSGWFSKNADAALSRIDFNGGNRAPVAKIKVNKTTGKLPLKVKLSAQGSRDADGDPLTYLWYLGDGHKIETTTPELEYTYALAGEYNAFVEVSDNKGASTSSASVNLYAGNEMPKVDIQLTGSQMFYFPGEPVNYLVKISDAEDGEITNGNENVYISANYIEGKDKAALPQGHQVITGALAGKSILEANDCKSCHKVAEKSVGPAFKLVAEKYKDDKTAEERLANKIIKGGGGVWGEVMMPAHPGLNLNEAKEVVQYIFTLNGGAAQHPSLPFTGGIDPTQGNPLKANGIFYLTASYTDKGGPGIKPITGSATVTLRNASLEAANADLSDGNTVQEAPGGAKLLVPSAASLVAYNNLDLRGISGAEVTYFPQGTTSGGYVIEALLDNASGTKLGEVAIGRGARVNALNTATIAFTPVTDSRLHTLYFKIHATPGETATIGILTFLLKH
ncbi:Glucose/arabinose dehydrogenase, beta-propeller fold [Chitinophaga costaii]|uniref:Glucose/arabinose dehydrogenase, beta-propeller fold n=1 Tax=Chitinophaga costaii TaxID=1335309 RepID=A0A1C4BG14_9BACT|nr:ThuA domain-containing protein [Chitinophaga costaii]PUZ27629.1 PKD domain-containing protein [Chitinophaga costaii]SCC05664.1 Glucose/arabinose dehydrogenase, beta-propeller fold [Chitinophaga costaii]